MSSNFLHKNFCISSNLKSEPYFFEKSQSGVLGQKDTKCAQNKKCSVFLHEIGAI